MHIIKWTLNDLDIVMSENTMYKPGSKNVGFGKRAHFLYKDPIVHGYQESLQSKIRAMISKERLPNPDFIFGIINEYRIGFPRDRYWSLDVTNCVKAIEDSYFNFFKSEGFLVDDKHVITNVATKVISPTYFISCNTIFLTTPEEVDYTYKVSLLELNAEKLMVLANKD